MSDAPQGPGTRDQGLTLGGRPLFEGLLDAKAASERAENGESELVIFGIVEQQPDGATTQIGVAHLRPHGWDWRLTAGASVTEGHLRNGRVQFELRKRVK